MMKRALIFLCVLGAAPSVAHAAEPTAGTYELTLPKGRLLIDAYLEVNLSTDVAFKPVSISPDVWYGITDDLMVGVVHSTAGKTGFIGGVGDSLCFTGSSNGCPDFYPNLGADVRYKIGKGDITWAVDGGLFINDFDPFLLSLKLGVVGRWHKGPFAVEAEPALFLGVTNRTVSAGGVDFTQNGDTLSGPISGFYAINPMLSLAVQTGLILPFQNTGDTWTIPLSIGVHYLVNEKLNINAAFTLTRFIGGSDAGVFDGRVLTIGGSYAL